MLKVVTLLVFMVVQITITITAENVIIGSRLCTVVTSKYFEYEKFYLLSDITDISHQLPIEHYVKIPINITTKYGDVHIILAEKDDFDENNRCYEFALGGWGNSQSEIRRKDYIREVFDLVQSKFAQYRVKLNGPIDVELSVSFNGQVKVLDRQRNYEFSLNDEKEAIPVKYIAFAGYEGHETTFTFNCSEKDLKISEPNAVGRGFSSILAGKFINAFILVTSLLFILM